MLREQRLFAMALALVLAAAAARADIYSQAVLADAPLAYWRLDETSGTTAFDSGGDARNAAFGGLTLGLGGAAAGNAAAGFDAADGDWMQYGSDLCPGYGSWTVETWVKAEAPTGSYQYLMMYYAGGYDGVYPNCYYGMALDGEGRAFWGVRDATGACINLYSDAALTDGRWHHLAGVLDRDASEMRLYVDGAEADAADAGGIGWIASSGVPVNVGWYCAYWAGAAYCLTGTMDEVAFFDAALNADRIAAHYAAAPEPATLALLTMGGAAVLRRRRR